MTTNSTTQRLSAEAFGTGILVFIGAGAVPATLMLADAGAPTITMNELGMIGFTFMFVIVALAYAIGHISGCHINPAVTVALAVNNRFAWRDVPGYVAAQIVGATIGAFAIVGVLGREAANVGLGATSFGEGISFARGTFAELVGTALLTFVVFGVIDRRAAPGWGGLAIGSIVLVVIVVLGPATGGAVNPARHLGPMLALAGFAESVHWGQLPSYLIGEFVGALVGALAYVSMSAGRPTQVR